jgi:DNA-binding NtrC family response regulator
MFQTRPAEGQAHSGDWWRHGTRPPARLAQRQGEVRRLTSDAEDQLKGYRWPGNVRELSAVIERAVMRRSREEIGVEELGLPSI